MNRTKIEWAEATWCPVTGCTPVSEGCQNCYAKRMAYRLRGRFGYPADDPFRVTLHPERLNEPLRWKKPRRVFVNSMGDLFHPDVPDNFLLEIFEIMVNTPMHIFMILTKRPQRMHDFILRLGVFPDSNNFVLAIEDGHRLRLELHKNIWLGVTAENQETADERIPILLQIPAAVRFVSVEPMLGPVDLSKWLRCPTCAGTGEFYDPISEDTIECPAHCESLDWIICGGETGSNARPCHPDWVRSLRDQAKAAGVPFFFKSWGQWVPSCTLLGKKKSGRLLDGRTWDEFPEGVTT